MPDPPPILIPTAPLPAAAAFDTGRRQWHEQRRRWRRRWLSSPVLDRLAAPVVPSDDGREPPTPEG